MRAVVLTQNLHDEFACVFLFVAVVVGELKCGNIRSCILEVNHFRSRWCDITVGTRGIWLSVCQGFVS